MSQSGLLCITAHTLSHSVVCYVMVVALIERFLRLLFGAKSKCCRQWQVVTGIFFVRNHLAWRVTLTQVQWIVELVAVVVNVVNPFNSIGISGCTVSFFTNC